eukprot:1186250-Prorocentrum_minimum.AAC.12
MDTTLSPPPKRPFPSTIWPDFLTRCFSSVTWPRPPSPAPRRSCAASPSPPLGRVAPSASRGGAPPGGPRRPTPPPPAA